MSPKRDLPKTRAEAERMVRDGVAALAAIEEAESWEGLIMEMEPPNRTRISFDGTFQPGGRTYTFVAIRADHYRGDRRWFVSQNFAIGRAPTLPSPATWVEVVEFATRGSIQTLEPARNLITPSRVSKGDAPRVPPSVADWHRAKRILFYDDRSGD